MRWLLITRVHKTKFLIFLKKKKKISSCHELGFTKGLIWGNLRGELEGAEGEIFRSEDAHALCMSLSLRGNSIKIQACGVTRTYDMYSQSFIYLFIFSFPSPPIKQGVVFPPALKKICQPHHMYVYTYLSSDQPRVASRYIVSSVVFFAKPDRGKASPAHGCPPHY